MNTPTEPSVALPYFRPEALRFLTNLKRNNRREWFDPRKPQFESELRQPMLALIERINQSMQDFAPSHLRPAQKCIMRIYRDIRFSPDKRPYKTHIAAWWAREGLEKTTGGGYYFHVGPDEVIVAAGVYMPEREQLRAIREYLLEHHAEVRKMLNNRRLKNVMEVWSCNPLTRAPKGFPKEHPAMDLLLCRQWGVESKLPSTEALKKNFAEEITKRFRLAAPLIEALNTPLLTHLRRKRRPLFGL